MRSPSGSIVGIAVTLSLAGAARPVHAAARPFLYAPDRVDVRGVTVDTASPQTAQAPPDADGRSPGLIRARELFDRQDYSAARSAYEDALRQARASGDRRNEARALVGLARLAIAERRSADVPELLAQAEPLVEAEGLTSELGFLENSRAIGAFDQGDWPEAERRWRSALAAYETTGSLLDQSRVLRNLTFVPSLSIDERIDLLERALSLARSAGDAHQEGLVLHQLGDFFFMVGDYRTAIDRVESALTLLERAGATPELARALVSLGRIYRVHGEPVDARRHYSRALEIQQALGDEIGAAQTLAALGLIEPDPARAKRLLLRAVEGARRSPRRALVAFTLGQLASVYATTGEATKSFALLDEADGLAGVDADTPYRDAVRSSALLALSRPAEAVDAATKALAARETLAADVLIDTLAIRALGLDRAGRLDEALAAYGELRQEMEKVRRSLVPRDYLKRGFAASAQKHYAATVDALARAGRAQEAFEVAESARARAFVDLLAARSVPEAPCTRPPCVGALARDAAVSRAEWIRQSNERAWQSLESRASAPAIDRAGMSAVAERLRSTIVAFWVGTTHTIVWTADASGVTKMVRVALGERAVQRLVRRTLAGEASQGTDTRPTADGSRRQTPRLVAGDTVAYVELYQRLVAPIRSALPRSPGALVTIVPHGPLARVSFAALRAPSGRYLVEDYRLHYAPSLATLAWTGGIARPASTAALVVADPDLPRSVRVSSRLDRLPGARAEGAQVARTIGASRLLAGHDATEAVIRETAGAASLVHFATHAVVYDDRPFESFLALGGSGARPEDDGRLTAEEVYDLPLAATLVVLSACRTASGGVSGDGIGSLTRGFLRSGAPSVVATLWDQPDRATGALFPIFYRRLMRGDDRAGALRDAQLRLLHELRAGRVEVSTPFGTFVLDEHPAFWAGPILVGEP